MQRIPWDMPDIGDEEVNAVISSIKSGHLGAHGPFVEKFENAIKEKIGVKYAIAVSNGTLALLAGLFALRDYLGKELTIGVPSFTFIASANTSALVGGIKLTDCNRQTWNIEAANVPDNIDVLMPVDVGGLTCDYDSLKNLGIPIIADSAESIGAKYKGDYVGKQADIHCFSLHRAKIITTGEGGIITTNNKDLYEIIKSWANHGYDNTRKKWQYKHNSLALNFRMTDLEAAIGVAQLNKLDHYVAMRRERARIYKDILDDLVIYQDEPAYAFHPYFFFGVLLDCDQNKFCNKIYELGIQVKTWDPAHKQKHFCNVKGDFTNTNFISERVVLLPIHNRLSLDETEYVAGAVRKIITKEV